jgi:hypothetical protein
VSENQAASKPPAFDTIVVHSRFFLDQFQLEF